MAWDWYVVEGLLMRNSAFLGRDRTERQERAHFLHRLSLSSPGKSQFLALHTGRVSPPSISDLNGLLSQPRDRIDWPPRRTVSHACRRGAGSATAGLDLASRHESLVANFRDVHHSHAKIIYVYAES
jgi:hypothetical protein